MLVVDTIPSMVYKFVSVGPPPPTLLVDLRLRSSRICLPIPLDSRVGEACICLLLLVFLLFWTMLVSLHISHIDSFHVPLPRTETMVAHSVSVGLLGNRVLARLCPFRASWAVRTELVAFPARPSLQPRAHITS